MFHFGIEQITAAILDSSEAQCGTIYSDVYIAAKSYIEYLIWTRIAEYRSRLSQP